MTSPLFGVAAIRRIESAWLAQTAAGELMGRAAAAVAEQAVRMLRGLPADTEVLLLVGPGNNGIPDGPQGEIQRRQLEAFILAFPTNLAPVVGQQITLTASSPAEVDARIDLLRQRADAGECELVAKTRISDDEAGFLYVGSGLFARDRRGQPPIPGAALRALAPVTYTCVPPGSGERVGVDRDGDGSWDGDERDAQTDPSDPVSKP